MNLFLQYKLGGVVGSRSNVGRRLDKANDDGTVLVEELEGQNEERTDEDEAKSSPTNGSKEIWQFLAIAIDRLLIIVLLVIYVISILTLIPIASLSIGDPINVEK